MWVQYVLKLQYDIAFTYLLENPENEKYLLALDRRYLISVSRLACLFFHLIWLTLWVLSGFTKFISISLYHSPIASRVVLRPCLIQLRWKKIYTVPQWQLCALHYITVLKFLHCHQFISFTYSLLLLLHNHLLAVHSRRLLASVNKKILALYVTS